MDEQLRIYEDLSVIHKALGEDWRGRLVEILRSAVINPATQTTLIRWEKDHGYRTR